MELFFNFNTDADPAADPFNPARNTASPPDTEHPQGGKPELSQWFTPTWAAERLFDHYFSSLPRGSTVCEFSCGRGNFLRAIPEYHHAFGVEIDPELARLAEINTGRPVITGKFEEVKLPDAIDAFVGNPPFVAGILDTFLHRMHRHLRFGGSAGMILPVYAFQFSSRVRRYNELFSIRQDLIPGKQMFPGLSHPLCFALFTKETRPVLVNFTLFGDIHEINRMRPELKRTAINDVSPKGIWHRITFQALQSFGGQARLDTLYDYISPRRPSPNAWWKEKIRQTCCKYFTRLDTGLYALPETGTDTLAAS
ncbi:class I SAM-dependent methyltransferase [Termitidicoccus mucosus]|uniref:Uncharacterized protein n=1 Tax=Termitidicoccus mucosus TaxID=1184151 RepID=A0A178IQI8_9BACT|nr:hypothetical protein AW736_01790 [Opitutaceae bacterium TSB47]